MNIIIIGAEDYTDINRVVLKGRRLYHAQSVLGAKPGQRLRVGERQGLLGWGTVEHVGAGGLEMNLDLSENPPKPLNVNMIVALPRPPMVRRILFTIGAFGVKTLHFIHSRRVEKSFWQSSSLRPKEIMMQLQLGLEQGGDTVFPDVYLHNKFKPFMEDELPAIARGTRKLYAHPQPQAGAIIETPATIIIGPEGGFVDFEIEQFRSQGFEPYSLGPRVLQVDTAVTALAARAV